MSLGMFCSVPLPFHIWEDGCMNLMLPCFPIVGIFIGALWWGAAKILAIAGAPGMPASAVVALTPFILSGFLHLDGYMDTSDAILSRKPLEEKFRILKDPHTGSFSVVMVAALFILQFAAACVVMESGGHFSLLAAVAVISRSFSALSILCLKTMEHSGYAKMMKQNTRASHKAFLCAIAACAALFAVFAAGLGGLIVAAAVAAGFVASMFVAYRDLKGVSGDLAGFALVIGELCGLIALACI